MSELNPHEEQASAGQEQSLAPAGWLAAAGVVIAVAGYAAKMPLAEVGGGVAFVGGCLWGGRIQEHNKALTEQQNPDQ